MNQPAPAPTNHRRLIAFVLLGGVVIAALLLTEEGDPPPVPQLVLPGTLPLSKTGRGPAVREIQWPEMSLAAIQQHDPFRAPVATPLPEEISPPHPPEDKPTETAAEPVRQLDNQRVSAILRTRTGTAALIEGKVYRTGDYLQPGVRIVSITDAGVTLQYENAAGDTSDQNL